MTYPCKYGHKHRTKTAVEWCHMATPWRKKEHLIITTPWRREGTTEEWSDLGRFRAQFWGLIRSYILKRDGCCQYEDCAEIDGYEKATRSIRTLEVHHIIPRRLGGTDHPANLIALCHDHHRIQPAHHHDAGLVLCDAGIPVTPFVPRRIRQARPESETTLADF